MVPDSFVGLALFAAAMGPGYVYLRVSGRREPRGDRTQLLETAELAVVGTTCTLISALLVLAGTSLAGLIDLGALQAKDLAGTTPNDPLFLLSLTLLTLLVSYVVAWGIARTQHKGKPASLLPDYSVWKEVFGTASQSGAAVFATVELLDGRQVAGFLHSYTVDAPGQPRELSIGRPIFVKMANANERSQVEADFLILGEPEIRHIAIKKITP